MKFDGLYKVKYFHLLISYVVKQIGFIFKISSSIGLIKLLVLF